MPDNPKKTHRRHHNIPRGVLVGVGARQKPQISEISNIWLPAGSQTGNVQDCRELPGFCKTHENVDINYELAKQKIENVNRKLS